MKKNHSVAGKGFTLIELLIVVAIIAILAAIAVPNFLEAQTRSKVSRTLADMRTVRTAIEVYALDYNKYPETDLGVVANNVGTVAGTPLVGTITNAPGQPGVYGSILRLTTPISYITSMPSSPWKENYGSGAGDVKIASVFKTYLYVRADVETGLGDDGVIANGVNQDYETDRRAYLYSNQLIPNILDLIAQGEWSLKSAGPDALDNRDGSNQRVIDEQGGRDNARIYDPTNGTVSLGDIVIYSDTNESKSK
ncbi:MAG: prepilin-type N-terminal cleavage/methylation domain-containing protein [Sumerlaeia bacterium]